MCVLGGVEFPRREAALFNIRNTGGVGRMEGARESHGPV